MTSSVRLFKFFSKDINVLVETGTYQGDGIKRGLIAGFKNVYSCDVNFDCIQNSKVIFRGMPVTLYHLPSERALIEILGEINERAVFFLDGHAMPPDSNAKNFSKTTLKDDFETDPNLTCPILTELDLIGKHKIKNHIILIDDVQCFDTWMFNDLSEADIIARVLAINPDYIFSKYENVLCCGFKDLTIPNELLLIKYLRKIKQYLNKFYK
jgi:hypothetical protein